MIRILLASLPILALACATREAIPDRPMKTQTQADAEEAAIRALALNDCPPPRLVRRRSIDIATLRDRIEERQPGRLTYFGGDLIAKAPNRKISLDLKDARITSVLRLLAEVAHTNLVVGDTVQGRVTLKLSKVSWDRVLLAVCQTQGLHADWEGNILHVRPLKDSAG
jgi:hypothetical protein